jgi:hypothetical protein
MNIKTLLQNKYHEEDLGHFYILSTVSSKNDQFLRNWMADYLSSLSENNPYDDIFEDPDITLITPKNKKTKNYVLEDFNPFFQFIQHRPIQKKRSLVVIDTGLIGPRISTKLLKTLEDPPSHVSIFLLTHTNSSLSLPLKSRAISLSLEEENLDSKENVDYFHSDLESWAYAQDFSVEEKNVYHKLENYITREVKGADFIKGLKETDGGLEILIKILLKRESQKKSNYRQKEQFIQNLQWFQEQKQFNGISPRALFNMIEHV